jgi:hypothetical protein
VVIRLRQRARAETAAARGGREMRAMVYRGPYRMRVEEKDRPAIEHPNDAIVRVKERRADLKHQPLDPVIVAGPWMAAGAVVWSVGRRVIKRRRG